MRIALLGLLLALSLTACGGDDSEPESASDSTSEAQPSETPSETPTEEATEDEEPAMAACEDLWVLGEKLPEDYDGCMRPDDSMEAPVVYDCDSGTGKFTGYDDKFYALLGGKIGDATNEAEYGAAYDECFADG